MRPTVAHSESKTEERTREDYMRNKSVSTMARNRSFHDMEAAVENELLDERLEAISDLLVAAGGRGTDNGEQLNELSRFLSNHDLDDLPSEPQAFDRPIERLVALLQACHSSDEKDEEEEISRKEISSTRRERRTSRRPTDNRRVRTSTSKRRTEGTRRERNNSTQHTEGTRRPRSTSKRRKERTERNRCNSRSRTEGAQRQRSTNKRRSGKGPPLSPEDGTKATATTESSYQERENEITSLVQEDRPDQESRSSNYPRIGPGYSDAISVVSDLTSSTVYSGLVVTDEDYSTDCYSDVVIIQDNAAPCHSSQVLRLTTQTTTTTHREQDVPVAGGDKYSVPDFVDTR